MPLTCRGRSMRLNCILYTKGDSSKLVHRKIKPNMKELASSVREQMSRDTE